MIKNIYFQRRSVKRQTVKQRSTRRRLCVVEPEISHNISKALFNYSKALYPCIKKAIVSVLKRLNAQSIFPEHMRKLGGHL